MWEQLYNRNNVLFFFGGICLFVAIILVIISLFNSNTINGVNGWYKPAKFFISSCIYVWSMAIFLTYLPKTTEITLFAWTAIVVLSFELAYITYQASQGQISHFNISSSFYAAMFSAMGIAISILTIYTLYIAYLFFKLPLDIQPLSYLWGIRLGLVLFVIFAFEGFVMGSYLSHTVGGPDSTEGIPFLNWSKKFGDLRVAHFLGMHALQILPLAGYFIFRTSKGIMVVAALYFIVCSWTLIQALLKIPVLK